LKETTLLTGGGEKGRDLKTGYCGSTYSSQREGIEKKWRGRLRLRGKITGLVLMINSLANSTYDMRKLYGPGTP